MSKELRQLQEALSRIPEGKISNEQKGTIMGVLADAWPALEGSSVEATAPEKLDRAKPLEWRPPCLTFELERHPWREFGSSRSPVHHWCVDVEKGIASVDTTSYRQTTPRKAPLDHVALVRRLMEAIDAATISPGISYRDNEEVEFDPGILVPYEGSKQTLTSRRKKVREETRKQMEARGWVKISVWRYRR
jgi:hypothetical protein